MCAPTQERIKVMVAVRLIYIRAYKKTENNSFVHRNSQTIVHVHTRIEEQNEK